MFDIAQLSVFLVASFLITIAPGPDIIFLITQSLANGRKAGIATALGLASGNLAHTLAAALGISVVFQTSPVAFELLKIAGVCYLLYLAYRAVASNSDVLSKVTQNNNRATSLYMRGVLMNVLNPKVALFFLAFLPQFVDANIAPVWQQMVFYGIAFTVLVVIVFGSIGLFAGSIKDRFFTGQKKLRLFRWLTAAVFIALALRLFFVEQ